MLNRRTVHGVLDLTFTPAGTSGFDDLQRSATLRSVGRVRVRVAALEDVIRSKETAGRRKDQEALPELYQLAGREAGSAPRSDQDAQWLARQPADPASRIARVRTAARDREKRNDPR